MFYCMFCFTCDRSFSGKTGNIVRYAYFADFMSRASHKNSCQSAFLSGKLSMNMAVSDFGSGKSGIRPFFGNAAKFGSGIISSRIWRTQISSKTGEQ